MTGEDVAAGDDMLGVDEALARVLAGVAPLPAERAPLLDALGRVLAEDVVADADIPPFRNSAMDGYAARAADLAGASRERPARLRVVAEGPAGYAPRGAVEAGTAIRIMTGAPLPPGADTVVRFEDTDEAPGRARGGGAPGTVGVLVTQGPWVNVREAGEDIRCGATVLRAGTPLRPAEIGVLASLNRATVPVHRRPVVALVATGDEVVDVGGPALRPGQIRNSNSYALAALVRRYGGVPRVLGVARDDVAELTALLTAARDADLIVSSGGVSVGDYDMVKDVLRAEGRIALWQVRMKPGKPLAFGHLGERPFLGLPGNPVAAFVSFELFGRPLLLRLLGHRDVRKPTVRARLLEAVENRGGRRHYVRATVARAADGLVARPTGEQGSGVLTALARCDGLLVVPDGVRRLAAGDEVEVAMLHWEQGAGEFCEAE
ncbi:MAG TPA: gephyrin-like molybdotransferase Glp [Thermomicrobiales bacterium]|nr:gephyrin-like molybdotransferase Glp [Thermomicrobiales bacterium]